MLSDVWGNEPYVRLASTGRHAVDAGKIDLVSSATRAILNKYVPEVVSTVSGLSDSVYFLPVSAIGSRPKWDGEGASWLRGDQMHPKWVSVPFVHGVAMTVAGAIAQHRRP